METLGFVKPDDTIQIVFNTYDSNGASVTVTNLAAGDVQIYKDGGLVQRSSASGITVSIDFDGVTGRHLISIDLSDDTDVGFYELKSKYKVALEGITVDSQTLNPWIGSFEIGVAPILDAILSGNTYNINNSLGKRVREITSVLLASGISPNTGGNTNTSNSIELDSNASSVDGNYDPAVIDIIIGTGAGQSRQIFQYDGSNKIAYVNRDWKVIPDNTSEYVVRSNAGDTHINEGKAQAGAVGSITLNTLASSVDNIYNGQLVFIVAGTGADQCKRITDYVGSTKVATVDTNWAITPDATSIYAILPDDVCTISATGIASIISAISARVIENDGISDITDIEIMKAIYSYVIGDKEVNSGVHTFKSADGLKNRIISLVDGIGNRTLSNKDLS